MARVPPEMSLEDLDEILPRLVDRGLPDGGEFLVAELRDDERTPTVIAVLVWHGFLPMGGMGMLLPKIHKARCILSPGDVHIGRQVRKRAKGFHLSVDQAWPVVVSRIQQLTFTSQKGDCWLSDELAHAYKAVAQVRGKWRRGGIAFHSIELWHTASGALVAGEIGYTCGGVYSSCTGFTNKAEHPGSGGVQLAALGRWLAKCGFAIWDLGMELEYKLELGSRVVQRSEWAREIRELRGMSVALALPEGVEADAYRLIAGETEQSAKVSAAGAAPNGAVPG